MRTSYSFWIGVILVMSVIEMKRVDYNVSYFSTGQSITLECDCKVSFWNGPVATNTGNETSPVDINDIYGDPKVMNVTIYMTGGKIANMLPETLFKRLNIVGDNFDLHITNLSTSNEGLYICDLKEHCRKQKTYQRVFLLQNKLLPSKLKIVNLTEDNMVNGEENRLMNLVCSVRRGKPPTILRWRNNGILISQGGSNQLVYSFIPNKSDHLSVYTCEAQNRDMAKPLTRSIHLNIKYKPSIKINISGTVHPVEGDTTHICCTSMSNPKTKFIFWQKDDKELVSAYDTSLCYKMSNVSRNDTGNYICSSQNELGDASGDISLIIAYPPVINIQYRNLTEYSSNREIRCLVKGEPNTYQYFKWEHKSLFNEHIRYLDETDDGILRLPDMNVSNIHQDAGFYICNVSNGIPDYQGNVFQLGRAYYLVSIGPPVIAADTKRVQDSYKESADEIKIKVYSPSKITCHNITEVDSTFVLQQDIKVRTERILIKESFHDAEVTVNGIEISFVLYRTTTCGSSKFNVTVCNNYGQSSFVVVLKPFVKSSDENALTSQEIINIVLFIVILVLITGIGVYIKYTKHRYRKRVITEINIQTAERNVDASPHYAEILEDSMLMLPQETDRIVPGNSNTTALSDDYSSSSSNTDNNASDDLNDGYEKPYTTLVSNNADKVEHVYRKTKQTLTYESATAFTNATLGHSVELQRYPLDLTKTNGNSNEHRANTDMHNEENDPLEIDDDSNRSNAYKQKETVEYINLSLKQ